MNKTCFPSQKGLQSGVEVEKDSSMKDYVVIKEIGTTFTGDPKLMWLALTRGDKRRVEEDMPQSESEPNTSQWIMYALR